MLAVWFSIQSVASLITYLETVMSKQDFSSYAKQRGVYEAALLACACGIKLATVQLWIRSN
jgi:hypothetical protein